MRLRQAPERRHFRLDPAVRGEVARQCFYYWLAYLLASLVFLSVWTGLLHQPQTWPEFWQRWNALALPALVGSTLLLPLIFVHSIRFSNRFSGPLYRVRKALAALSRGESVEHVALREGDYWSELAGDVERLSGYVDQLQRDLNEARSGASDYRNFIRPQASRLNPSPSRPKVHST